jgi:hypothetical protein
MATARTLPETPEEEWLTKVSSELLVADEEGGTSADEEGGAGGTEPAS